MPIWRYIAVEIASRTPLPNPAPATRQVQRRGELVASSSAEVRQSLRRIGLQAIDIRPAKRRVELHLPTFNGSISLTKYLSNALTALGSARDHYLRKRRRLLRAELYDSLTTMLESGLPLADALAAISGGEAITSSMRPPRSLRALHHLVIELRTTVAEGTTFAAALQLHPSWFDAVEVAMVEAALHAGTLSTTLRNLADREERADQLTQQLIGALMYPAIVMLAAIGVTIFLSTKTLPDLTSILVEADVTIPQLTIAVMAVGQFLATSGILSIFLLLACSMVGLVLWRRLSLRNPRMQKMQARFTPQVWKSMVVGVFATTLAELVRSGIPVVDAFRILAPTMPDALRVYLNRAADRVEHGEHLADVFGDPSGGESMELAQGGTSYFTPEFRRLIETAQVSGDLAPLLERIGKRYQRQAKRQIDRLATLLEPLAIITLALLVGTVVMAAILPLIRLQEVIQ